MIEKLVAELKARYEPPHEEPAAITQSRHRIHLQDATAQLSLFLGICFVTHILVL